MTSLVYDFEELICHLNAEDNDKASEFLMRLKELEKFSSDGWIIHNPDENMEPKLEGNVRVIFGFRDGSLYLNPVKVSSLNWGSVPNFENREIVRYKIVSF